MMEERARRSSAIIAVVIIVMASMMLGTPSGMAATSSVCGNGDVSNDTATNSSSIDLFDYKVASTDVATSGDYDSNSGVNGNGTSGLGFRFGMSTTSKDEQGYYDSSGNSIKQSYVLPTLDSNGYPQGNTSRISSMPTNLKYLFGNENNATLSSGTSYNVGENNSAARVASHYGIPTSSLLTKGSDGYYSFDSSKQYAYYDSSKKEFTLTSGNPITATYSTALAQRWNYDNGKTSSSTGAKTGISGGFFPFNTFAQATTANTAAISANTGALLSFTIPKSVSSGYNVYVTGSTTELGSWTTAHKLTWNTGDKWTGSVLTSIPSSGNVEYKFLIANSTSSTITISSASNVTWQSVGNSTLSASALSTGYQYSMTNSWSTAKTGYDSTSSVSIDPGAMSIIRGTNADDGNAGSFFSGNTSTALNHYFGMHVKGSFTINSTGTVGNGDDTPITYSFSGDDDAYVYIDGILFMNLGGTHTAVSGTINFHTGKVTGKNLAGLDDNGNGLTSTGSTTDAWNGVSYPIYQAGGSTLKGIATAYASSITKDSDGNIYNVYKGVKTKVIDGTTGLLASGSHSIDFYYLERGAGDSNLSISYNLSAEPTVTVSKKTLDSTGNTLADGAMVLPGDTIKYAVTVINNGDTALTSTRIVRDELPSAMTYVDESMVDSSGNSITPSSSDGVLTWSVTGLAAGASETYTYSATVGTDSTVYGTTQANVACMVGSDGTSNPGEPTSSSVAIPVRVLGYKTLTYDRQDATSQVGSNGYDFTVIITPTSDDAPALYGLDGTKLVMNSDGTYTIPITYDSSTGKASYGILVPQGDSTADWSYTIRESNGHLAGMTYDSTVFTVNGSTTVSTVSLATGTRTVRTGLVTSVHMNNGEACDDKSCTVVGDAGTGDYTRLRLTNSLEPVMAGMVNTGSRSVWLIVVTVVGLAGAGIALRRFL